MIRFKKIIPAMGMSLLLLAGCTGSGAKNAEVKREVVYELGDKVTLSPEAFVEGASQDALKNAKVTSVLTNNPKYDYNGFTYEVKDKNEDYLGVGTYPVTVLYNGKTYESEIVVKDTLPPTFVNAPSSISVAVGDTSFDPAKRFRVQDKGDFDVSIEGDYDINVPGNYDIEVVAKDVNGNQSSINITLKVVDGQQIITSEDQEDEDFNDINQAADDVTQNNDQDNSTSDSSTNQEKPGKPDADQNKDNPENPDGKDQITAPEDSTNNNGSDKACNASNVPSGSPYYYSFEEAYAAGTAWNQQAPGNYFVYLLGQDDCGATIYVVTFGNSGSGQGAEGGQAPGAGTDSGSSSDTGKSEAEESPKPVTNDKAGSDEKKD